ncbi:MAG: hypothetical protein KF814_06045 [Nitrospiraceae bacterium]|nr:hypothetical protein [Nitrospiraceae bacterium]
MGIILLLCAPNLVWLKHSTVRVENRGQEEIQDLVLYACSQPINLGSLAPGGSRFRLIPHCGEDSLEVRSGDLAVCNIYVEGQSYHVLAWLTSPMSGDCTYKGAPPFSPWLVGELL